MKKVLKVSDLIQNEEKKESNPIKLVKCMQVPNGNWKAKESTSYYNYVINLGFKHCYQMNLFACYKGKINEDPIIWLGHLNDGTY